MEYCGASKQHQLALFLHYPLYLACHAFNYVRYCYLYLLSLLIVGLYAQFRVKGVASTMGNKLV